MGDKFCPKSLDLFHVYEKMEHWCTGEKLLCSNLGGPAARADRRLQLLLVLVLCYPARKILRWQPWSLHVQLWIWPLSIVQCFGLITTTSGATVGTYVVKGTCPSTQHVLQSSLCHILMVGSHHGEGFCLFPISYGLHNSCLKN